jgi:putative addiction module killer protein
MDTIKPFPIKPFRLAETTTFSRWLSGLKDYRAKAAIIFRLKQVAAGHWGDVKNVGGGVSELRWHIGPGYRVYVTRRSDHIVLLLAGGNKSTQARDIAKAKELAKEHPDEQNH